MQINDTITRDDGATFRVVGIDGANRWVLAPLSTFGAPIALDAETIRAGFDVDDVAEPRPVSEAAIIAERVRESWTKAIRLYGERYGAAERGGGSSEPHPDSPEGRFRSAADTAEPEQAIRDEAARIFANPDELADYEVGLLDVPDAVAAALDRLLAERDEAED